MPIALKEGWIACLDKSAGLGLQALPSVNCPPKTDWRQADVPISNKIPFQTSAFLASAGPGRSFTELKSKETCICQGDAADSGYWTQFDDRQCDEQLHCIQVWLSFPVFWSFARLLTNGPPHSHRKATMGSTFVARRAGMKMASKAALMSSSAAPLSTSGS